MLNDFSVCYANVYSICFVSTVLCLYDKQRYFHKIITKKIEKYVSKKCYSNTPIGSFIGKTITKFLQFIIFCCCMTLGAYIRIITKLYWKRWYSLCKHNSFLYVVYTYYVHEKLQNISWFDVHIKCANCCLKSEI